MKNKKGDKRAGDFPGLFLMSEMKTAKVTPIAINNKKYKAIRKWLDKNKDQE